MMIRGGSVLSEALLAATVAQGFSPEVARAGLEAEIDAWRPEALAQLERELPPGWRARAPRVVLVIAARTLPASALRQCLLARALGATVRLKCAAGQEGLGLALHVLDPGIIPTPFASDDEQAVLDAIEDADTVVVLGSDQTVRAVRARTPPDKGFAPHGHKVSAAWFGSAGGASDADVRGLAEDLVAWDQAGCLSPQLAWVAGDVPAFARRLVAVMPEVESRLPLADVSAHRIARRRVEPMVAMLGGQFLGTPTTLLATLPDPSFRPSPGPRILWLLPADPAAVAAVAPTLSTLAVTGDAPPIDDVRVCAPGEMQRPPLAWRQDGLHPLAGLLRP